MMLGCTSFAVEPLDELFVEREGERQDLDRHVAFQLLLACLEDDGHPAAAQLVEDLVLVFQLLPHQIELRRLGRLITHGGHGSRMRQIQSAGAAELAGVVVLGAAAGAVHQISEGSRKLRDLSDEVSTRDSAPRAQKSEASAAYTCGRRAAPDGGAASGC